jgi:hypothetical protein
LCPFRAFFLQRQADFMRGYGDCQAIDGRFC